jgi:hypothetical protein
MTARHLAIVKSRAVTDRRPTVRLVRRAIFAAHMSDAKIFSAVVIACALLRAPSLLSAQTQSGPLATAKNVKCTFSLIAVGTLREDQPKAEVKPGSLVLEFEGVNADEGTARLKSGFGEYDIVVRYASGYLHFIQSFRDGPLYVTTILEQKTKAGKLKAMHSRHEFTAFALPGFTSSPEQYYGECEIKPE